MFLSSILRGDQRKAMPNNNWRSPAAYAYLSNLSTADLAFEFLRRNPEYRADFQRASEKDALGGGAEAPRLSLARRWGLAFPGRSQPARGRSGCVLASPSARRYRRSDGEPG
jgi:hypothetical protein